ncbi:GAF domain-containing protein [Streptomyces sp. NPDC058463]|uniref:GAF domain-containing protein n=1 Tax=Streptomyces sp. NPDC058463 TaxID=3346510 RepID=UPI00365C062A
MISPGMTETLRILHLGGTPLLGDDCARVLGMDHAVVSLVVEGRDTTEQLWASGETSASFDDLQFTLGEGPGPDTLRTRAPVLEQDVTAMSGDRWPALLPAMRYLPIRAVFCLPLALGGITVGVLTVLRSVPGPMTGQQMDDALALAGALTLQFLGGEGMQLRSWTDEQPGAELHRAVVHQASGMLSVQLGLSLGQSLLRLRAYAYGHDTSIVEAAQDIVSRRLRLNRDRPESGVTDETSG